MDGQTLELWFWTLYDGFILHLRQVRLTVLTWAADLGLLELPEPPWWLWALIPAGAFGLGLFIGWLLPRLTL